MATDNREQSIGRCRRWLVFCSSFLIGLLTVGQLLSFGVYFVTLSEYFQLDKKTASSIGGTCFACAHMVGPLAGVLQQRHGARLVVMIGATLATFGMIGSYFAQDYWHLYISYSLLSGAGIGLCVSPALAILPEYFEKNRYLVTVLFMIAGPLGAFILAPFTLLMIETYTWRGSMLINAGLCAQLFVFAAMLKSRWTVKDASIRQMLTASVLKDCRFVLIVIDGAVAGGACFVVFSTITDLAISRGLTIWESASLVSIASLSTTVARILAAFISVYNRFDRLACYTAMSVIAGAGVIGCVFASGFMTFSAALCVFGLSYGMKMSQMANVIIDFVGVESIAVALGYYMLAIGNGGFFLPLVSGWFADKFGPDKAFVFIFCALLVGFCLCLVAMLLRRRRNRKGANEDTAIDQNENDALNVVSDAVA